MIPSVSSFFSSLCREERGTFITIAQLDTESGIKAVQGDSGHAQVNMVTDVYSHIIDEDRKRNAELFEEAFYEKKNLNPEMVALLSSLAKSLK